MTNYWKMRVKVFGVDRAFLPMILMGAMHDDIDEWKSEVPTLCYFAPNDAKGRSVICFQRKVADVHALTNSLMVSAFGLWRREREKNNTTLRAKRRNEKI